MKRWHSDSTGNLYQHDNGWYMQYHDHTAVMAEKEDELIDLRRDYEFLDGSYTELQAKCERMEEVIRCASNLAREYRKHGKGSIELSELCDAIALTEKK